MKIAVTICRYLLGLMFTVFGLNGFLHFLPSPMPANPLAQQFMGSMAASHHIAMVFALQLISGVLLLSGFFVPLALTVLAGIILNILTYHLTMDPKGIGAGVLTAVLWLIVFAGYRNSFAPLFRARAEPGRV